MSIFATNQKKNLVIDGVNFVIKKLTLEKQLTISALWNSSKQEEATLAIIQASLDSWDAKDDSGNLAPLNSDNVKLMAVDVANKLAEEIMAFNNLNKDQIKN